MKLRIKLHLWATLSSTSILALTAQGAAHTVHFDTLPPGLLPNAFISELVNVTLTPFTNTVGNVCAPTIFGAAIIGPEPFPGCPAGSAPNQLTARSVLVEFNMSNFAAQVGGPVKQLQVKYRQLMGNVQITFNNQCFTRPTFGALPNGNYGGVKYNDNGCRIRLKRSPTPITQFAIGGGLLAIDDVKAKG